MNKFDFKKYKKGTIVIEVQSMMPEKFINLLWKRNVIVKNIKRINITTIQCKINLMDYDNVIEIVNMTRSKIKIMERKGISFILLKKSNIAVLVLGLVIFITLMTYFSTYIWEIGITTEKYLSPYEIRQQLKKYAIIEGIKKSSLDVHELEERIVKDNSNVSWVRARIEGTSLNINIYESVIPPEIIRQDEPCDIIASKDGEVIRTYSTAGTAVVDIGQIVKKGDLLIKGEQGKEGETYAVHAQGYVIAKTFYEKIKKVPLIENKRTRTGNKVENIYVKIGEKKFYIKKGLNKFNDYDKIVTNKGICTKEIYYEVKSVMIRRNDKEIIDTTVKELYSDIIRNLSKTTRVTDKIIDYEKDNNTINVRLLIVAEENIAVPVLYNIRR